MKPPQHGSARTPEDWQAPRALHNMASKHGYKVMDQEGTLALYGDSRKGTLILHHDGSWHHTSADGRISEGVGATSLNNHLSKAQE